jgi:hypothetical protein
MIEDYSKLIEEHGLFEEYFEWIIELGQVSNLIWCVLVF